MNDGNIEGFRKNKGRLTNCYLCCMILKNIKKNIQINCRGSGTYSNNAHWEDLQSVCVLIDPETGNLVDILEPNYFYHYAPEGDNRIFVTSSYRWSYIKKEN